MISLIHFFVLYNINTPWEYIIGDSGDSTFNTPKGQLTESFALSTLERNI